MYNEGVLFIEKERPKLSITCPAKDKLSIIHSTQLGVIYTNYRKHERRTGQQRQSFSFVFLT